MQLKLVSIQLLQNGFEGPNPSSLVQPRGSTYGLKESILDKDNVLFLSGFITITAKKAILRQHEDRALSNGGFFQA